jgi:hypothetical protein
MDGGSLPWEVPALLSVKKNAVREKSVQKPSRVSHKNDFRRAPFSKAESFQESLSTSLDAINKSNEREMLTNQKLLYPRFAWLTLSLGMGCTCLAGHAPLQRVAHHPYYTRSVRTNPVNSPPGTINLRLRAG